MSGSSAKTLTVGIGLGRWLGPTRTLTRFEAVVVTEAIERAGPKINPEFAKVPRKMWSHRD